MAVKNFEKGGRLDAGSVGRTKLAMLDSDQLGQSPGVHDQNTTGDWRLDRRRVEDPLTTGARFFCLHVGGKMGCV
jgi:hypothetical protein